MKFGAQVLLSLVLFLPSSVTGQNPGDDCSINCATNKGSIFCTTADPGCVVGETCFSEDPKNGANDGTCTAAREDQDACVLSCNNAGNNCYEIPGEDEKVCGDGLSCIQDSDTSGTCQPDSDGSPPGEGTERITICHRTCSQNNPWVRITIDKSAWEPAGDSKHKGQHDVMNDCNEDEENIDAFWGGFDGDYPIKDHGTRQDVRDENGWTQNSDEEKAYWKQWEPACPSVRSDECCGGSDNLCCGVPLPPVEPTDAPVVTPTEAPKTPTEAPKTPTEAPKTPTEAPKTPTEAPKTPTEAPKTPTEAPKTPTEAPKTPTEAPKTPTEAPKTPTDAPHPMPPTPTSGKGKGKGAPVDMPAMSKKMKMAKNKRGKGKGGDKSEKKMGKKGKGSENWEEARAKGKGGD